MTVSPSLYASFLISALLVAYLTTSVIAFAPVTSFSLRSARSSPFRSQPSRLLGVLDDLEDETTDENVSYGEYEILLRELIFSTSDTARGIRQRLAACAAPGFLDYLSSQQEASEDAEERQALGEVLHLIEAIHQEVNAEQEAKAVPTLPADPEPARAEDDLGPDTSNISTADVLRKAQQIDQAYAASRGGDDEGPDKGLVQEAREVVNLSPRFNNRGQMRVGG